MTYSDKFSNGFQFFGNREMTSLYLALGLLQFGEGLISIFIPIYFWGLGFSLARIIFFYFLISAAFLTLTFLLLPLLRRLSDKMMMFLSIPFTILYFLGLGFLENYPALFYLLPVVHALNILLFNVGYHLDFSGSADGEYIGREVGARYMVSSLMHLSSPALGGVLISVFGFESTFFIGSAILFAAILPLFFFPKRTIAGELSASDIVSFIGNKALRPFTWSGVGFATEKMITIILWPLFLFFSLGDVKRFGGIESLALLSAALITFLVGFLSDAGRRRRVLKYSTLIFSLIWIFRVFLFRPAAVVGSHLLGYSTNAALMVAWSSQYYKIARAMPSAAAFILSREVLYHVSRVVFLPLLAAGAYFFTERDFFELSFVAAALLSLLFLKANLMPHAENLITTS